ncbi:TPA: class D beta-lactamase [Pseudomonas aeruginosa]|nr:class D beta-lactamase [Pseudomonas aeruginosa]HCF5313201.1 class D beta-lactamase [Pseudomonas aeruginosa]HCF5402059.1 class D beta-lactamase [Pseudomonas aeruginosa]
MFRALLLAIVMLIPFPANAQDENCTIVIDAQTGKTVHERGDCGTRRGAQSTFKIPLALMGFDSGILKNEHTPEWSYREEYNASLETHRHSTDPARWEKESVVWYSQELTKKLGMEKFKNYVDQFGYGNRDVSGDAGKDNGLTHAWLSSSLKISPREQTAFVRGILEKTHGVSPHAYDMTKAILPEFAAGGWTVHGKTGTGFKLKADGTKDRDRQEGWFVGWAEKDGSTVVFANFIADTKKENGYAGPRARDAFLKKLPAIMTGTNERND